MTGDELVALGQGLDAVMQGVDEGHVLIMVEAMLKFAAQGVGEPSAVAF